MNDETATRHVEIKGEMSIFTALAVRQQLLDAFEQPGDIEVDLASVSEVDSAGVQLLIAAKREAALHARVLRFTGHSRAVFDLLELYDVAGQLGDPVLIPGGTI
jgi:anti-anti-sigma factor